MNKVTALKNNEGSWVSDSIDLKNLVNNSFQSLFTGDSPYDATLALKGCFLIIDPQLLNATVIPFEKREIRNALFDMQAFKDPILDGFQAGFY